MCGNRIRRPLAAKLQTVTTTPFISNEAHFRHGVEESRRAQEQKSGAADAQASAADQPLVSPGSDEYDWSLDLKTLEQNIDAQDGSAEVVMVWVHGYYTGLQGINETNAKPISWQTVDEFAKRLDQACRQKPHKLWAQVVRNLKSP